MDDIDRELGDMVSRFSVGRVKGGRLDLDDLKGPFQPCDSMKGLFTVIFTTNTTVCQTFGGH